MVSIKRNRHKNEVMNKSVCFSAVILSTFLLFVSCNDNRRASYISNRQENKEFSVSDSIGQKTHKDSVSLPAKKYAHAATDTKEIGREKGTGENKRNHVSKRLQDFRKRTVSKYFAGTLADSLSVGRAELKVPHGSMEHAKILSITPLRKGELPHLPAGMVNVTADRSNPTVAANSKDSIAGYRFLPHGEHFVHSLASITVPYDSTLIPQGYTAEDIHTYYYDELKAQWVMLRHKVLDKDRELVVAETSHFTDVINGIIKVPENPETQNYVPTGISELKAADPSAGITTVSAPTANQSGTAALSYPFELPKGRAGMQPSVGLQYSSDGGSSYVGYGWSLPLQSIDIETRWGVPRFDADKESESYLLMGSKLNDRTYRTTNAPARTKDKRFYPLVEGGFAKIIRKGDNPQNYTWEVTSKDGTVSYFGGVDGTVDEGAVLKDGNGNILRWALCKTQDTHGNFVSYKYLKKGNNLYPDTYHYTGSKEGEGIHSVNFTYTATERKDITSGARMGVLQYDSLLLKKVSVLYKDELLRAYDLNFEEGEFGKTLLKSINQKDSKDHLVATQSFDYYNDIKNGMFGKGEQWTAEQDSRDVYIRQIGHKIDKCSDELTMLGGGYSKGKTYGGGLMVGFGVSIGTMNVGASYTQSKNNSVGKNVLIDIDGDGLPDKVFQSGGGLRYRKNLFGTTGKNVFGKSIAIKNIGEFSRSTSWSKSVNADAALDLVVFTPGVSYSKTWDNTETPVYFSDFNNDGLVDIAKNGTVWFNKIDADGVPTFTPSTTGTGNPIIGQNAEIDKNFIPDYKAIRDSLEKEYPLHDVVRVWCAPFKGTVSISSKVEKTTTYGDGIIYSIQKEKNVLKKDSILGQGIKQDNLTASVNAGDRIFFRLQSRYSGVADSVGWAPQITYTQIIGNASSYLGQDFAHYDAEEDFLEGMTTGLPLQKDGRVEIKAPYKKDKTNDDVTLIIRRKDVHGENVVEKRTLPANAPATGVLTRSLDILEKDSVQLSFEIQTVGALNWKKVEWTPTIKYASDPNTVRVTPFKQMYNKPLVIKASKPLSGNLGTSTDYDPGITLVSKLKVIRKDAGEDKDTASVWMHINREDGTLLHKRHYTLSKGDTLVVDTAKITDAALLAEFSTGKLQTTFNIPNELQSVDTAVVQVLRDSLVYTTDSVGVKHFDHKEKVLLDTLVASVFSGYNSLKFGHLYKGWGQFGYNGNGEYANEAIDPDVLQIKTDDYKDMADKFKNSHDPKDLDGLMETNKQRFFIMAYDVARKVYISATDSAYIGNAFQCSSRMGESEIKIDSVQYVAGEGLSAPVLKTKATGDGFAVSAGADVGVVSFGVSGSKSWQTSYTKVAAMDINGDGYPDWIDENNDHICTQYTAQTGTLSNLRLDTDVPLPKFDSDASTVGANIGGAAKGKGKGAIAVSICSKSKPAPSSTSGNTTSGDAGGGNEGGNSGGNNNSGNNSSGQNEDQNAGDGNSISSFSVSASGDFTSGTSTTRRDWLDWNGDGLPDMLIGDKVRYNLGYGFTGEIQRSTGNMESSSNSTWGAGLGTSINILGPANISFGFNGTKTTTLTEFSYADLNGDGLPDMVSRDGDKVKVSINTGTGFINDVYHGAGSPGRSLATSVSGYGNTAVKFSIHLLFLKFSLTPSIKAAVSEGVSRTENALVDIDGDGYPDFVESDGVDKLIVHRNLTGRTNLLKGVILPFGGHVAVEYKQTEPSYNMPGRRWVMTSVETIGGYVENGATKMRNEFEYEGGYRDRRERDFYGFEKVITKQIDTQNGNTVYRKQVAEYGHNRHFYMHDLVTAETLYDAAGNKLQGTQNTYELKQQTDTTVYFPALVSVKQTIYDNNGSGSMSTTVHNTYDAYGNLASYKEMATNYELDADIAYHDLQAKYIVSVPKHIAVKDKGGKVYRERSTQINGNGDITSITMHNSDKPSVYDMTYDAYGNLASLTKPENHKGQRMRYDYTYDDVLHALVTSVKDAYGYTSSTAYDYKWAVPVETSDLNGNKMRYAYDDMGRPSTIVGPKEIAAGKPYTIKFEYHPAGRYARTVHYSPEGDIETYTFADSLMRAVQTKQTGVVWTGGSNQKVSIVSGRAVVDAFGRAVKAFYPTTESYGSIGTYNTNTGDPQATTEYDVYDRTTKVALPDGATTTTAYSIVSHDGEPMLETKVTDALGRHAESYTDEKGRNRETVQHASGDNITVKYDYDAIGQVTTVHHPNDKTTTYEYDLLGRKLKVNHPDAGEVTCTYDAAGNLLTKLTAELKKRISADAPITYTYDYERLSEVLYPKNLFNRVTYTYGKPGEKYNRAGRLVLVEDASGGEAYYYGNQGEVVKTVRSVMVSTADVRTYVYGATYDSWNRVRTMTYPDGEVVTYAYNAAGQIASVKSNKQGKEETIVEKVGYDKDGHTVYTKLGNGTETTYTYDKQRERLQEMNLTAAGTSIMHNKYQYDAVDNILGITNAVDPTRGNTNGDKKLGGAFKHSYAYDDLNRLVYASGKAKQASYSMQMTFGRMSEPLTKVQKVDSTKTAQSYDFTYKYEDSNHPTAPTQIGHEHYTYDANGNPTLVENDSLNTERRMYWDEDNRLMVLSDNGKTCRYTYNAAGERIIKSHGDLEGVYINGAPQGITFHETEDYTIYPAPIITVTKNRYTKHYFIGDKRIASKIGTGKFSNVYGISGNNVTAGQKDYAARMMQIEKQREEYYKSRETPPGIPTMKGATADPDNTHRGYNNIIGDLGDHSVPEGWVQRPKFNEKGDVPGPPIQWGASEDPDNAQPGYGYIPADTTNVEDIFFYHSDHLGSTSYITDAKANITQFDAYLPYGELLVDEHSSSEDMPYKFNGKELDEETGLYYYGERYYDPRSNLWLGIDPLTEKYTNISAYLYCHNNPVRFVDPDGRSYSEFDKNGNYLRTIKDNWWHNFWHGRTGRIVDGDGNVTQSFKFADPKNDVADLKNGTINKVYFVQESEIISMLSKAGAFNKENKIANADSRYGYIKQEGVGGGKFDFSYTGIPNQYPEASPAPQDHPSSMLFLVDGVAHNHMNFGNFLFGAAGKALGLTSFELRMGAHWNSLANSSSNGYRPQFDSDDDQFSIQMGVRHADQHGYKDMYYRVIVEPLVFKGFDH